MRFGHSGTNVQLSAISSHFTQEHQLPDSVAYYIPSLNKKTSTESSLPHLKHVPVTTATMTGRLLLLTGAPESRRLDWAPGELLTTFEPSIAQFARLQPHAQGQTKPQDQDISVLDLALWRSLPLVRTHIRTGFSQQHDLHFVGAFPSSADFLTTASISFEVAAAATAASQRALGMSQEEVGEESSRLLAEFYEHSLAVHDDVTSSQLAAPHSQQHLVSQQSNAKANVATDASFVSDTNSNAVSSSSAASDEDDTTTTFLEGGDGNTTTVSLPKTPLRPTGRGSADHLSDLEDIPPASYLVSIVPATMTVTLVVGIISIAAPRTVETRFGGPMTLVEVLVGDETKSGFSVTFWLSERDADAGGVLKGLRGQDVVLMQNVALNVFRKKVYGGSLRKGMTRVCLLYRGRTMGEGDEGGYYSQGDLVKAGRGRGHPQLEKTRRVRDWVLKFVGVGVSVGGGGKKTGKTRKGKERAPPLREWNQPPPLDSQ